MSTSTLLPRRSLDDIIESLVDGNDCTATT